mgnify:CR=1 FL=1
MKIKILSDNTVYHDGLLAEHGLSIWFEYGNQRYLFDTGQGHVLNHNAKQMNIDFKKLEGVIISHDHDDHSGGLQELLQDRPELKVIAHPKIIKNHDIIKNRDPIETPSELTENVWLTGEIPIKGKNFTKKKYKKAAETENIIFIKSKKGLIVLTGCSHPGIINVLDYIHDITEGEKIYAVIGGMHLINKGKQELNEIISKMNEYHIEKMFPLHCTGINAMHQLLNNFDGEVLLTGVGEEMEM